MRNPRSGTERLLVTLAALALGTHGLFLAGLGFFLSPAYDPLSARFELAWRFWKTQGAQLPHFNPFFCGGQSLGADPTIPIFHPLIPFVSLLGAPWLIHGQLLAELLLGSWGLWRWLKGLKVKLRGRAFAGVLFLLGGPVVQRASEGKLDALLLLPLFFALTTALGKKPFHQSHPLRLGYWALALWAALARPSSWPGVFLPVALHAVLLAILHRRLRFALEGFVAIALALLASAIGWLPSGSLDEVVAVPWRVSFLLALVWPDAPTSRPDLLLFMGPAAVALALYGAWKLSRPSRRPRPRADWLASLAACLAAGTVGLAVAFASLGGSALSRLVSPLQRAAFFALAVLPLFAFALLRLGEAVGQVHPWSIPRTYPTEIVAVRNADDDQYAHLKQGRHILHCPPTRGSAFEGIQEASLLQPTLSARDGSLAFDGSELVAAHWVSWNRIRVSSVAAAPFTLALNLNHSANWRFEGIGTLVSGQGEPLQLASFRQRVEGELVFETPGLRRALPWSILGLALFAMYGSTVFVLKRREARWHVHAASA